MQRLLLGIIGLTLTLTGASLYWFTQADAQTAMAASICFRVGLVLSALWLALPQTTALLTKYPPWVIISTVLSLILFVINPKLIVIAIPLVIIIAMVQFVAWVFAPPKPRSPQPAPKKANR